MEEQSKTTQALIQELVSLRRRIAELEQSESEGKQAEESLQKSYALLKSVVESPKEVVIFALDRQYRYIAFNQNHRQTMKRIWGVDIALGNSMLEYIKNPEDCLKAKNNFDRALSGESFTLTEAYGDTSLDRRYYEDIYNPIIDGNGNVIGLTLFLTDITERKQVDEELKLSEEKFSTIFRLSPACISLSTLADGRYVAANDLWFKIAEYSHEEVIGHTSTELGIWVNPEDRKRLAQTITESGVVRDHEYLFRSKSGKIYSLLFSAEVIEINGIPHIVSIASNITERIRAEVALRESEQRLSAFIDFLPDATLAIDENKRIIIWNRAIEEMTGIPAEEMIGKGDYAYTIPFYGVARPQLMDLFWEPEHEIAAKYPTLKREGENFVIEVFCPALYDGKGAFVWAKAAPLRDSEGRLIGAIECIRDINERKQAEDEIRRVTTFLDSIVENIPDMIFVKDAKDLRFVLFNRAGEDLLGYSRTDLLRKNDYDFFPKEQADFFTEKDRDVLRRKEVTDIPEEPIQTSNKGERILHTQKVPILDAKGEPEYLLGISEDITERKKAEEALQGSEERYRNLVESAKDVIYTVSPDGKITSLNPAFEVVTGWSRTDWIGKFFAPLVHPDDLFLAAERLQHNLQGKITPDYELRILSKSGEYKVGEFGTTPQIQSGKVVSVLGVARDITDRKQAEEEALESHRRLADIIEFLPDATLVIDKDGKVIAWNRALEAMTGVRAEEMLGKGNYEYALPFYGERRPILIDLALHSDLEREKEYTSIRRTGDIIFGESYTPKLSPGNIHLSATASALRDTSGEIIAAIECIRNNTERKRLEAQLQQAQKMESIGTLAGGIAHDFNNILSAILGYTDMALVEHKVDDHLRLYLEQVFKAGERARDLVNQILTFSRQRNEKPRPLRVSPIIKEVLKLLMASLPSTIHIHQDIQCESDTVDADPTQIHQILMNLCTNAAHAMRETKGELKISLVSMEIKPGDTLIIHHDLSPGMYLKLTVSDTGVGMAPDTISRIFDPFFTTKKMGEGTGMGLSVVYGIVKGYNGAITVESEPGKGTEFQVYLPLLKETKTEEEIDKTISIVGGNEHILFVDDEKNLVQLGKDMLTGLGYEVVGRASSVEALEMFRVRPRYFDLVITDMTMPNMTGVDLAKEMLMIRPDIPIILCTGFSEIISEEKAKNIGIRQFIMKPLLKSSLAMKIREVLDTR